MSTIIAPQPIVSPAEQRMLDVLLNAGFKLRDGWFYPAGDARRAAVRWAVFEGQYQLWRRVRLQAPWMMISVADVEDFDERAFDAWRAVWPLTH